MEPIHRLPPAIFGIVSEHLSAKDLAALHGASKTLQQRTLQLVRAKALYARATKPQDLGSASSFLREVEEAALLPELVPSILTRMMTTLLTHPEEVKVLERAAIRDVIKSANERLAPALRVDLARLEGSGIVQTRLRRNGGYGPRLATLMTSFGIPVSDAVLHSKVIHLEQSRQVHQDTAWACYDKSGPAADLEGLTLPDMASKRGLDLRDQDTLDHMECAAYFGAAALIALGWDPLAALKKVKLDPGGFQGAHVLSEEASRLQQVPHFSDLNKGLTIAQIESKHTYAPDEPGDPTTLRRAMIIGPFREKLASGLTPSQAAAACGIGDEARYLPLIKRVVDHHEGRGPAPYEPSGH
jgi:hypothetical protein